MTKAQSRVVRDIEANERASVTYTENMGANVWVELENETTHIAARIGPRGAIKSITFRTK